MTCQCKTERQKAKCPWYIGPEVGIIEKNDNGEQRLATGCFPEIMLRWMFWVAKTNAGAAAAFEDCRNHTYDGFNQLIMRLASSPLLLSPEEDGTRGGT